MAVNRPGGRDVTHTGGTGNVNKKGSGLGTGPVGNVDYSGKNGGSRRSSNVTRGIGGGGGLILIAIAFFLIKNIFGGGSSSSGLGGVTSGASTIMNLLGSGTSYETTATDYSGASSSAVSSSTDKKLDTSVAKGARDKYTVLKGNAKDEMTILVYMCGTDLESKNGMGSADLREMANATINSKVKLIVYTGGCKQWKTGAISSSVNQIYRVENGGLTCLEKDMGSKAMTDPNTLVEFINYGMKNYSSNRMALIFWDHGGGSISGYGYDEKYANSGSMTLAGINTALKKANVKFDFIGFDACLMATLENGLMLADYADYMIASEETEPGVGWYYTNWLTKLASNTSMPTIEVGKNIVDDFVSVCNQKCPGQKTTLSVVDLAELSATVPGVLTDFAKATSDMINGDSYKKVSDARSNTREFAQSNKIDQIDLIDFAKKLGTSEAKALANALDGAIKYNRTSSTITDSWGISIFFPYKKPEKVTNTVQIYNNIGMDTEYARCIKAFASLEVSGQVSGGGASSALGSLLGSGSGSSASGGSASSILSMLGGLTSSSSGLTTANGIGTALLGSLFSDRAMSDEATAQYLADNYFDSSKLVWTEAGGKKVISLTEEQWSLVQNVDLNVWYDDGEGYIDLGMDNILNYDAQGNLIGDYDGTWLSLNGQVVAYYRTSYMDGVTEGYIPVLLNGKRAELNIVFNKANPAGIITGAKYIYVNGETDTAAKSMIGLEKGDKLEFICDYYDYQGNYHDSYILGDAITLGDTLTIANIKISDTKNLKATYCFTDIYQERYWTPEV